ncbi:MAG: IPT/TIG domain-containing protein [Deltaproteobacteria bacterium]|nr:IPT/TIG domain-containing protein [Deltaproteobacteria bacterium]MCW5803996.1 IPT/TIG domain-containing protein [Deltaproteobacteria bacterium]
MTRAILIAIGVVSAILILLGRFAREEQHEEEVAVPRLRDPGPPVTLTGLDPVEGETGTPVILHGTNFTLDRGMRRMVAVHFGGKLVKVIRVASDHELIVEVPRGKPGDVVDVHATFDPGGKTKLAKAFTYR